MTDKVQFLFPPIGRNITMDNFFTSVSRADWKAPWEGPKNCRHSPSTFAYNVQWQSSGWEQPKEEAGCDPVLQLNKRRCRHKWLAPTHVSREQGGGQWFSGITCWMWPAYTSFTSQHPRYMSGICNARRLFIKELGQELVMPHMKRCLESTPRTPKASKMGRCGIIKQSPGTTQPQDIRQAGQGKRKRCAICTTSKDRKASSWCSQCTRPVCKEHRHVVVICEECKNWIYLLWSDVLC